MKNRNIILLIAILLLLSIFECISVSALTFGDSGTTGSNDSLVGYGASGLFTMGANNGIGDSISAYLTTDSSEDIFKVTFKLYYGSNGTAVTNGLTSESSDLGSNYAGTVTLNFISAPNLRNSITFFIVLGCSPTALSGGVVYSKYATSGGNGVKYKLTGFTYPNFPTAWTTLGTVDSDGILRAYCTYHLPVTNPNPPSDLVVSPVIASDTTLYVSWTKGTGADYTRVQYKTGSNPTSISDGINGYNNTGSSYTQNSLTTDTIYYFSAWSFNTAVHLWSLTYISANNRVYVRPLKCINFIGNNLSYTKSLMCWTLGYNGTITRIQFAVNTTFPTTISSGTNAYNSSNTYLLHSGLLSNSSYYYSAWTFNSTNRLWSSDYTTLNIKTNDTICPSCGSITLTVYNYTHNVTGKYETAYSSLTGCKIWLNFTGLLTPLHIRNDTKNVTKSFIYKQNSSGWWVFDNDTGILTPLHLLENIGYSIGTHVSKQNNSGYYVYANYTTGSYSNSNIINATGTHTSSFYGGNWHSWANYTGITTPLHKIENIINASGSHDYILNLTGYWIYANYTGFGGSCPSELLLYLYENILNATGTHEYVKNSTGYLVYANYTGSGNGTFDPNTTDVWLYLGAMLTIDNSQFNFVILLTYLFALLYFIYNSKTNDLFIRTKAHYIFILSTIVLLLGIEIGAFVGYGITDTLQRALLLPFLLVLFVLLWLTKSK